MKYLMQQIRIFEDKNERGIYRWLRADLFVEEDPWANPSPLPRLYNTTDAVVNLYMPFATVDATATNSSRPDYKEYTVDSAKIAEAFHKGEIKDLLHVDQVFQVTQPLGAKFVRIYRRDTTIGTTTHTKGEYRLGENGEPIVVDTLVMYLKKFYDPNISEWKFVEDPSQVAQRILQRDYVRYVEPTATTAVATAPVEPSAPAQTPEDIEAEKARLKARLKALGI